MIIPVLNIEDAVQIGDLTRFTADKSLRTKGSTGVINSVNIKAGADAAAVEVFEADNANWYLDWLFSDQNFDIDITNNVLNFKANEITYRALVPVGVYVLADLLSAVKLSLEAIAPSLAVTITKDDVNRIKITANQPVKLLLNRESACLFNRLNFYDTDILVSYPIDYSEKAITLTVATDAPETNSIVKHIKVYTEQSDRLFSSDADLVTRERDIMKWTSEGRSSFLAEHRKVQTEIMEWLFKEGYYDTKGRRLNKWSIVHTDELRQWAIYKTLAMLMLSFSNSVDDIFASKYQKYSGLASSAKNIYSLTLDRDNDGAADSSQDVGTSEGTLRHR